MGYEDRLGQPVSNSSYLFWGPEWIRRPFRDLMPSPDMIYLHPPSTTRFPGSLASNRAHLRGIGGQRALPISWAAAIGLCRVRCRLDRRARKRQLSDACCFCFFRCLFLVSSFLSVFVLCKVGRFVLPWDRSKRDFETALGKSAGPASGSGSAWALRRSVGVFSRGYVKYRARGGKAVEPAVSEALASQAGVNACVLGHAPPRLLDTLGSSIDASCGEWVYVAGKRFRFLLELLLACAGVLGEMESSLAQRRSGHRSSWLEGVGPGAPRAATPAFSSSAGPTHFKGVCS